LQDLNSVILEGRLTRDPEMEGNRPCKFGIASNRSWKKGDEWQKETLFMDVVAWGKTGENCLKYLEKGQGCRIAGRLQQETWEKDGKKQSKITLVAEHVEFAKKGGDKPAGPAPGASVQDDFVDDIPF